MLAPYDGIITKRNIEPSQQTSPGQAMFEIEGKHGLEVRVMVPENLIQELELNTILPVRFPVIPGFTLNAQITEIGTRAESANAFPITVVLQNVNDKLRAGMTAEVDFTFEGTGRTGFKGQTVSVPVAAIGAGLNQNAYVFVYDSTSQTVKQRQVQTENIMGDQVYISSGLSNGEIIATAGVAFLKDGQAVTLLDKHVQRFN
jgi:RND family efflux transporter MFP subunit